MRFLPSLPFCIFPTSHVLPPRSHTGLDHIEKRRTQLGLLRLQLIDHVLRQVFLQQRMAVFRILKQGN